MDHTDFTTDRFAKWVTSLHRVAPRRQALDKAQDCLLDAVGCAISGHREPAVTAFARTAQQVFKSGASPLWLLGQTLNSIGAASVNAASASALDLDDGNRQAMGHPGSAVVPAALAVGEEVGASMTEVLTAILAGYEIAVRLGAAEQRPSYHSGNYTSFGVAAAAGFLRNLAAEQIAQSLAICAYHGSRVADLTLSADMGASVKESIPWSVVVGLSAVELASTGFTGPRDALDLSERYDAVRMQGTFGDGLEIERTYFKRISCCRWMHSATEGFLTLIDRHKLSLSDIAHVEVETFAQAANLNNYADPPTMESAQYSVPFAMALAATHGEAALMPLRETALHDPRTVALARKIAVRETAEMNKAFPARVPARVTVQAGGDEYSLTVEAPWGEASRPPGRDALCDKFRILAAPHLTPEATEGLIAACLATGPEAVGRLQAHLRAATSSVADLD